MATTIATRTTRGRPRSRHFSPARAASGLVMLAVTAVFLLPYAWMVLSSFKTTAEVFRYSWPLTWKTFVPPAPTIANYQTIFTQFQFARNLLNSVIVAAGQTIGTLVVCSLAAFIFARVRFRGREALFAVVMLASFIPFEVVMVPMYVVARSLHLTTSYLGLFLPWIANPLGIYLLRQTFLEIPREYDEAAMLEGANLFQIFWHVILPNSRPALITLALISAVMSWNMFLWPLIVMQDPNKQVVQVAIATFTEPGQLPTWGELFAAASVATVPVLLIFLALQRYYVRGMVMAGIKG